MLLLSRLFFTFIILATAAVFILSSQTLKIETNLNDLNPEKIDDAGIKLALDTLNQDVSNRFVIVITGSESTNVSQASRTMQKALNKFSVLTVMDDTRVQENYLTVLAPYRYNFLSLSQRDALTQKSNEELAEDALRRLYQLGDGVRVIAFKDDPLGWFSDYILASVDALNIGREATASDGRVSSSFSVKFNEYPQSMAQQEALYQAIIEIEEQITSQFKVTVLHSGMFFFAVDSASSAKGDIQLIAAGSALGVLVLMILVFRSLTPLLLSLGSIVIGVSFGVLVSALVFGSVHVLTIVFGASLIGIVVDYSLHYFYHFLSHENHQSSAGQANTLIRAMILSVLTSLIGYGALALSDLFILKKVALFSCAGLFMAWLSVMVLGPFVTKRPIKARQALLQKVIHYCQRVFARNPRLLVACGLVIGCTGALYLATGQSEVNDDPRRFFHVSKSLLAQEKKVASLTQVYEPGRYLLVQAKSHDAVFDILSDFYDKLDADSGAIFSVLDWLTPPIQQRANYVLQQKLYEDGGVLDIFSAKLGLAPATVTANKSAYRQANGRALDVPTLLSKLPSLPPLWIEQDGQVYSFALIRKDSDLARIEQISALVPEVTYVNTLASAREALKAQRETGAALLVLAYLLIAIVLSLYYRQLRALGLLLIPAMASLITLMCVSLLGQAITVFHIMALFLVLGLGMDYIIFAREMAAQRARTQQAILLSAVTSLLSFGLLAFSSMPIVQAFGSTILIGNSINFIAAISLFNGRMQIQETSPDV